LKEKNQGWVVWLFFTQLIIFNGLGRKGKPGMAGKVF
jgi:hypothetical protein